MAHTFAVSGMLWNRSLVMIDLETRSLWSHILGDCHQGKHKGKQLEQIPAVMTDWGSWQKAHPDTTCVVLSRSSVEYKHAFQKQKGRFVLGLAEGGAAKAWTYDFLGTRGAVSDTFRGEPVLVVYHRPSTTARAYRPQVDGRSLSFRMDGDRLADVETESTWDPVSGRATAGALTGKRLTPLTAIVSYKVVWKGFHPDTDIVGE